ncbi:MAG TPA: hypothetical protein VG293_11780 [Solirubrobacteraceae bacterium]|nr:hypothetical protein [Solirubrobacteraceae bacterium]
MSEKRQRQQQRRARRQAVGRTRRSSGSGRVRAGTPGAVDFELAGMLAGLAEIVVGDAHEPNDALEAEHWASCLLGALNVGRIIDAEIRQRFRADLVPAVEELASSEALATLRALSGVGVSSERERARAAADRLAACGVREPAWASGIGVGRPVSAALQYDQAFDDGVSVIVEFDGYGKEPHTLGIYIDHNMDGLVKDVFLAGPLIDVRAKLNVRAPNGVELAVRELELAEARARIVAAFDVLDETYDPPVDEDVSRLRALVEARIDLLPAGLQHDAVYQDIPQADRERMLEEFLDSTPGKQWAGDEHAEDVVATAIDFGADYNHGGPLRWSPVVVEIFMTNWVARKVVREPAFFERLPDVLVDWVAYAGALRHVPPAGLNEAIEAVAAHRHEMLEAVSDPDRWGPAKAFALAARSAGVDPSDPAALDEFVEQYNAQLQAD